MAAGGVPMKSRIEHLLFTADRIPYSTYCINISAVSVNAQTKRKTMRRQRAHSIVARQWPPRAHSPPRPVHFPHRLSDLLSLIIVFFSFGGKLLSLFFVRAHTHWRSEQPPRFHSISIQAFIPFATNCGTQDAPTGRNELMVQSSDGGAIRFYGAPMRPAIVVAVDVIVFFSKKCPPRFFFTQKSKYLRIFVVKQSQPERSALCVAYFIWPRGKKNSSLHKQTHENIWNARRCFNPINASPTNSISARCVRFMSCCD